MQAVFPNLDSGIILSRSVYQEGRFPAIDILSSNSAVLNSETVGEIHYQTALDAQVVLKKAVSLERIVSLIGEAELSVQDQVTYKRAKMLKNYMTQNFTVVETQTEKKGIQVPVKDVVKDVRAILDGKVDILGPEDLLYIGTLKDVEGILLNTSSKASQTTPSPKKAGVQNPQQKYQPPISDSS